MKAGALGGVSESPAATGGNATATPHGHGHGHPLASLDVSGIQSGDKASITVPGVEENIAQNESDFGKPTLIREEVPRAPLNTPVSSFSHGVYETKDITDPSKTFISGSGADSGESRVNLQRTKGLKEDPHAPKNIHGQDRFPSNYETKVTDPTGAGD